MVMISCFLVLLLDGQYQERRCNRGCGLTIRSEYNSGVATALGSRATRIMVGGKSNEGDNEPCCADEEEDEAPDNHGWIGLHHNEVNCSWSRFGTALGCSLLSTVVFVFC